MKKIILLVLIIVPFSYSQTKYLIYFKDKGITPGQSLRKTSVLYKEALSTLSARCIARREKVMNPNQLVTYEDIPIKADYITAIESLGVKIENKLNWFNAVSAYLTTNQVNKILQLSFVEKVNPVKIFNIKPNMPVKIPSSYVMAKALSSGDYGPSYPQYELCDIPAVQAKGINGKGVVIGILDDGFRWKTHESLAARNVLSEYNYVFHTTSTTPQPGDTSISGLHGTYVFSILAGYKDSSIIGPAYNASFILAKTEDDRSESHIEEDNYAAALEWMESQGVDITTSSLGYNIFDDTTYSYTYQDMNGNTTIVTKAVNLAFQRGVLTFTAAGNEGADSWHYVDAPADAYKVIAVGAVYNSNVVAGFSSRGPTYDGRIKPDVVTQGVNVYGANAAAPNAYYYEEGTSCATPIASGIGALLLSAFPKLTNIQARNILLETSDNYNNPNNDRGYGLMSAEKALSFPNIYQTSNTAQVNKIFFSQNGIQAGSTNIHYAIDNLNFTTSVLSYDDTLKYSFQFPSLQNGQTVYFYFTYNDSLGNSIREPQSNYYSFIFSGQIDSIGLSDKSAVSVQPLTQNFPNPFSKSTTIKFDASSSAVISLTIYNEIGQVVKSFSYPQSPVLWDGKSDSGAKCASGMYFYVLKTNGKMYAKKMILVR